MTEKSKIPPIQTVHGLILLNRVRELSKTAGAKAHQADDGESIAHGKRSARPDWSGESD